MPERELPRALRQQLSSSLESGPPLASPLPSQARYAKVRGALPEPRWRVRALTVAVAVAGVAVVALAGPPEPRDWIVQSMGTIAHDVGVPLGAASPSPSSEDGNTVRESPEASETPETKESPEAPGAPEPSESPEPAQSPDDHQPQPSPTAEPSDGHDGGGDHSPEPSPSS